MSELLAGLESGFSQHFGAAPQHVARAPGRVNLIGEHTDYNDGFVLPCAVEYHTLVGLAPRDDDRIEVLALDWQGQTDCFSLAAEIAPQSTQPWCNYIRGVVVEMQLRGFNLVGANLAVTGNVPQGAGLSSSAALEMAVVRALAEVSGLALAPAEMAVIGQAAENNFVGCACGIMDQLISAAGQEGYALGIDCRSLELTPRAIPAPLSLLIVNSNVQRGLVDSEYNLRRAQCEAAASHFGRASLRDVGLEELIHARGLDPVARNRAQHVLEENHRVLGMLAAFEQGDIDAVSRLMMASHRSMRELFEITTPEIDCLVDIIAAVIDGRGGVRMTGGGFGGCVVSLLPDNLVGPVVDAIARSYQAATGLAATVYRTAPSGGVGLVY